MYHCGLRPKDHKVEMKKRNASWLLGCLSFYRSVFLSHWLELQVKEDTSKPAITALFFILWTLRVLLAASREINGRLWYKELLKAELTFPSGPP